MKKVIALLLALTMTVGLVACGSGSGEESTPTPSTEETAAEEAAEKEPVEIEFACWGAAEESTSPAFYAMIEAFEEKYDWITVNVTEYAYNNLSEQLLVRAAGGTAPDVAQCAAAWLPGLVEMDVLTPMNDLLSEDVLADFYENALAEYSFDGKAMAAVWTRSPMCMFYNKTLLEAVGYSVDDLEGWTWEDYVQMSYDIAALGTNEDGNAVYGRTLATAMLTGTGYYIYNDLYANDAAFVDADGNVTFYSEGTVAAFEQYRKMAEDNVLPTGLEIKENRTLFGNGQVGFHVDGPSIKGVFLSASAKGDAFAEEIGVAAVPGGVPTFSSDHLIVSFAQSEHPEECALLIDYLTGPEATDIYTDTVSVFPGRYSTAEIDYYAELDADMQVFAEAASTATGLSARNASFNDAMLLIAEALQRVTINQEEPEAVVQSIDAQLKELYSQE